MLKGLIRTSLRFRQLVLVLAAMLLVAGVPLVQQVPLDVFPEFAPPLVEVQTEAPGLSTTEVEQLITTPLEHALNGVPWLATLRSKSVLGLSSVTLQFARGTDLMRARQLVQERTALVAESLPALASRPVLLAPLSSTSRLLKIGVTSAKHDQVELSTLARWTIRPRLMAIPGVANVAIWGQRDRELQVIVDPDALRANGVTLYDVLEATGDAVAPSAGGFVDTPNQRFAVMQRVGVNDAKALADVVIDGAAGAHVRLGTVAAVGEGFPPPIGDAVIDGGTGLLLIVEKQPWSNTLEVTRAVERTLSRLQQDLGDVRLDPTIFRPATFIEQALGNLTNALWIGCVLVVAVLLLFLFDLRTALISCVAIPLSLLSAALVLSATGATINTMVLAGLALALGEVVDDAIIDVENIQRRLRLNRAEANPRPVLRVVLNASLEVRTSVVTASVIIALVFLPVFFLPGLAGAFFRPLALAYVLAVLASLLTALTVTPALALLLLRNASGEGRSPVAAALVRAYRAVLPALVRRHRLAAGVAVVLLAGSAVLTTHLGRSFLPDFQEYDFLMHWVEKPGTSLEAMKRITVLASNELRAVPGVRNFGSHIGRAEVADEVVGPNFAELWISVSPDADHDATVARVQAIVDGYPGLQRDLLTYLRERVKEVLSGTSAAIVVRLYGEDVAALRSSAARVGRDLGAVPGVADLKVEPQVLVPQVEIVPRPDALSHHRLSAGALRRVVATLVNGTTVGEVHDGTRGVPVAVRGAPRWHQDPTALASLPIELNDGGCVSLGQLADVRVVPAPNVIRHDATSRCIDVSCNVRGRDLGEVARDVEAAVAKTRLPAGQHVEVLGEAAALASATDRILLLAAFSLLAIFMLLHVEFGSFRLATMVFAGVPFALVGGVAAVALTGGVMSLGSLVGFVTVLGIAARNGILLVSHWRHLEQREGEPFSAALVIRGACERLQPILMTALATALALLPIALGGNKPGHEIEHPMAAVIVGGLATSTLLNLVLLPPLYLRFARARIGAR